VTGAVLGPTATYVQAATLDEAVAALAAGARPIAGGTDLVVGARHGKAPLPAALVGIHRLPELGHLDTGPDGLRIGATVTHATLVAHPAVLAGWTGLADACAIIGSVATRARGTIGGNVMNASPAMDTGAPLLCLGAVAVLRGPGGERRLPVEELWTGPGTVSAAPDELLVALELPPAAGGPPGPAVPASAGSAYVRLQYRRQMEIAVVGAAAAVRLHDGVVTSARIAITALAPTVRRVPAAEAVLVGARPGTGPGTGLDEGVLAEAARLAADAALPISDVRASAAYRRAMAEVVVHRAVRTALTRALGGTVPVPASATTFGS